MMRLFFKIIVLVYFIIMSLIIDKEIERQGSSDAMSSAIVVNAAVFLTALSIL